MFGLSGFQNCFYTRRDTRGGGIGIFVKDSWSMTQLDVKFTHSESLAVKLSHSHQTICLLALYRPPSSNCINFLQELRGNLEELSNETTFCLVGDINIDTLKNSQSVVCDYLSLLAEHGISPTIQGATREEVLNDHVVSSCLDHINVRSSDVSVHSAVILQKLADHFFVTCQCVFSSEAVQEVERICRLEMLNLITFDRLIKNYDWNGFLSSVNSNNIYPMFINILNNFRNSSKKVVYVRKRKPSLPWLTPAILDAITLKEQLWKKSRRSPNNAVLKLECKIQRNRVNALLRSAKRSYFSKKIRDAGSDSRKTWCVINELRGHVRKNMTETLRDHFGTDMTSTAQAFNNFFKNSAAIPTSTGFPIWTPGTPAFFESAFLPSLTGLNLRSYLFGFRPSKSAGVDNITAGDLCRNYDSIKDVLLTIINDILETGNIPTELKQALVVPLYKGGVKDQVSSYRPISILSCISQILEKHLFAVMTGFLDKHSIISSTQYGFVAGRGTIDLLENFSDTLHYSFENNMYTCALFIDVAKAFDTVNHDILLYKLCRMGFRGPFYSLLANFLSNRTQVVSLGNSRSSQVCLTSGVPQGSILSPLLFNIYVNDLPTAVTSSTVLQYADDTVLFSRHLVYEHAIKILQADATALMDWFSANKLRVNTSKTKLVCFCNPLKVVNLSSSFFLHESNCLCTNCEPVQYVSSIKYLGIYFDCDLSWRTHMSYLCQRLRTVSCLMYSLKCFVPLSTRRNVVHALAYSLLRYGITVFFNCPLLWHTRIDRILRGLLKSVAYRTEYSSSDNLFASLELPSFYSLFLQTVVWKHFWGSEFKIISTPVRELRAAPRFHTPKARTRYGESMREYYVPNVFNSLPDSLLSLASNKSLKKSLRSLFSDVLREPS
uniref:Putative tick transposon n=1 Tax=Ixodes ricinus TaxID=34613 RepID=A0A131Y4P1_IXORI